LQHTGVRGFECREKARLGRFHTHSRSFLTTRLVQLPKRVVRASGLGILVKAIAAIGLGTAGDCLICTERRLSDCSNSQINQAILSFTVLSRVSLLVSSPFRTPVTPLKRAAGPFLLGYFLLSLVLATCVLFYAPGSFWRLPDHTQGVNTTPPQLTAGICSTALIADQESMRAKPP